MGNMIGADVEALQRLALQFEQSAERLRTQAGAIGEGVRVSAWVGPVAVRFQWDWDSIHSARLKETAEALERGAGVLKKNATSQQRASAAAPSSTARPHEVRSHTERIVRKFGVVSRSVESGEMTLVEMSDGTFVVRATAGTSLDVDGTDVLAVASLTPQGRAASLLKEFIGGSVSLFGRSDDLEVTFGSREDAEAYMQALRDEANEFGGFDGLRRDEMVQRAVDMEKDGVDVRFGRYEIWDEATTGDVRIGVGPVGAEVDSGVQRTGHFSEADGQQMLRGDSLQTVVPSAQFKGGAFAFDGAGQEVVSVSRNDEGQIVKVTVTTTVATTSSLSGDSSDVISALSLGKISGMEGTVSGLSTLISGGGSADTGLISVTSTTYDLTTSEGHEIAERLGAYDPDAHMDAAQLRSVQERIVGSGIAGDSHLDVYRQSTTSEGFRAISYDYKSSTSDAELVYSSDS